MSGRAYTLTYFGLAASFMVVLALLEWTLDLSLVRRTVELSAEQLWSASRRLLGPDGGRGLRAPGAGDRSPHREEGLLRMSVEKARSSPEPHVPLHLSLDDPEPMYRQIESQLRDFILGGQLEPGTRLPSMRALARDLSCSVITTRRAYEDLEGEGFIWTRQGMGTLVAEMPEEKMAAHRREAVDGAFRKPSGPDGAPGSPKSCAASSKRHYRGRRQRSRRHDMTGTPVISLKDVRKSYGNFELGPVDLALEPGYVVAVVGPNGGGKSTLIRALMNLIQPDSGELELFGGTYPDDEVEIKRRIGYVPELSLGHDEIGAKALGEFVSRFYPRGTGTSTKTA